MKVKDMIELLETMNPEMTVLGELGELGELFF